MQEALKVTLESWQRAAYSKECADRARSTFDIKRADISDRVHVPDADPVCALITELLVKTSAPDGRAVS